MKRYILTGGTSSGKTATLLSLEIDYGYNTLRESAENWIKLQKAKGIGEPWSDMVSFQNNIARLDIEWENRFILEHPNVDLVVKDRSVIDCIAFFRVDGLEPSKYVLNAVEKMGRYDGVFLLENLGVLEESYVRREDLNKAIKLEELHKEVYQELGYKPIIIPNMSLEERVKMILDYI